MKNKYFILAFTFLCLLMGQSSFGQMQGNGGDYNGEPSTNVLYNYNAATNSYDPIEGGDLDTWSIDGENFAMDATGNTYFDINGDGYFDTDEAIDTEESTSTGSSSSSSGTTTTDDSSSGSYSGWGGGYSSQPTYYLDDDNSNDVASLDNTSYYGDTSYFGALPTYNYSGDSSSWNNIIVVEYSGPSYVSPNNIVYIKSADGTYKKPSQLDPNSPADSEALHEFAASLARNLDGMNKNIGITSKPGNKTSSINAAFTQGSGSTISLNSNGGFSKDLDNVNNFKSILKHEIFHVDDNRIPNFNAIRSLSTHADVYIRTAQHDSFKNTTKDFQIGNAGSFALYLLNLDRDSDPQHDQAFIRAKIAAYNNNTSGKVSIVGPGLNFSKGTLTLYVDFNGEPFGPINYKKIDE